MKIRIEANGHRLIIPLPIKVALNDVTILIIAGCIKKYSNVPLKEECKSLKKRVDKCENVIQKTCSS
jgi:hypothetical protein